MCFVFWVCIELLSCRITVLINCFTSNENDLLCNLIRHNMNHGDFSWRDQILLFMFPGYISTCFWRQKPHSSKTSTKHLIWALTPTHPLGLAARAPLMASANSTVHVKITSLRKCFFTELCSLFPQRQTIKQRLIQLQTLISVFICSCFSQPAPAGSRIFSMVVAEGWCFSSWAT